MWMSRLQMRPPRLQMRLERLLGLRRMWWLLLETLGLVVGKWAQHDGIDYAEHCGIRADAQCQSDYGNRCEAWVLAQLSESVTKIL